MAPSNEPPASTTAADDNHAGQSPNAGLHHPWLADGVELGRIRSAGASN
jgi:hypothetical protein